MLFLCPLSSPVMAVGAAGQVASTARLGGGEENVFFSNRQTNTCQENKTFPRDQFWVLCGVELNLLTLTLDL